MLQNVRIKCIFAQRCWTFYNVKCTPKCILASNAFCRFLTFCKQNVRVASNAFVTFCVTKCDAEHFPYGKCTRCVAKMHFCIKCIFASNAFLHQMHFCTASNAFVTFCVYKMWCWTFSKGKCTRCVAKMHFCIKCIFASNAFLHQMHFCKASNAFVTFCWCWTFSFGKCDAEHFPLENVRQNAFCRFLTCLLNIFLWKMYAEHFPKENVRKNAFLHQMHFCIKCIFAPTKCKGSIKCIFASNAFLHSVAEHFPKENVQHQQNVRIFVFCKAKNTAFLHQKHFSASNILLCWTFSKAKC